jgi:hypothetical protein
MDETHEGQYSPASLPINYATPASVVSETS